MLGHLRECQRSGDSWLQELVHEWWTLAVGIVFNPLLFSTVRFLSIVHSIAESLANPTLELIVVGNLITWMSWSSEKKIFYDSWPHFTPIYIYTYPIYREKWGFKNRKRSKQGQIFPIETGGLWSIDPTTSPTPPPEKIVKKWSKPRVSPFETIVLIVDRWLMIDRWFSFFRLFGSAMLTDRFAISFKSHVWRF